MSSDSPCVHGYGYADRGWENPKQVLTSDVDARPGYTSKKAHEYEDVEEVLVAKVKELIALMRKKPSETVLYTGAGISTAAGKLAFLSLLAGVDTIDPLLDDL